MTTAIPSSSTDASPAPGGRLGAALAASAVAHGLLLTAPAFAPYLQGVSPGRNGAPMTVRLAPAPIPIPNVQASPPPEEPRAPLRTELPPNGSEGLSDARSAPGPAGSSTEALSLPGVPDPNYYAAPDLDSYPRPLTALRIALPLGAPRGEVRLEVLIDERGIVRDVSFASAVGSGGVEEELRAMLAATRFFPAVKDGRAVRSRILLSLTQGAGEGGQ
jgi:protein TonB